MIRHYEIHNQSAVENANILINGPYRDPHTKPISLLSALVPLYCKIIADSRKWSV